MLATAEALPFPDATFDLSTVASAIDWFEPRGLHEIRRVLKLGGGLFVYDVCFPARDGGPADLRRVAQRRMREPISPGAEELASRRRGGRSQKEWEEDLQCFVPMTRHQLVEYLMTRGERITAVQRGQETEDEQRELLLKGVAPFFRDEGQRRLRFGIETAMYRAHEGG